VAQSGFMTYAAAHDWHDRSLEMIRATRDRTTVSALAALRVPRLRALFVSLFLALQTLLVFHQLEHGLHLDLLAASDDCLICQATANALPVPEPSVVTAPMAVGYAHPVPVSDQASLQPKPASGFHSRAPPTLSS